MGRVQKEKGCKDYSKTLLLLTHDVIVAIGTLQLILCSVSILCLRQNRSKAEMAWPCFYPKVVNQGG
jgi:hypothetical protein